MRRASIVLVVLLLAPAGVAAIPELIRVQPLARDGQVFVSFELSGGFPEDVRQTIRSGLPTSFAYELELRRGVPLWFDRTIAHSTVVASVQYDNLTRRHQLSRSVDGRVEAALVTEDEREVERWLTAVDRLPIFSTAGLEPNGEYYVRVRAQTRPRSTWSLWPFDRGGAWGHARFTFIP